MTAGDWKEAGKINEGDAIRCLDGACYAVEKATLRHEDTPVYNLTVDHSHTYAVSELRLIVHNKCPWAYLYDDGVPVRIREVLRNAIGESSERWDTLELPGTLGLECIRVLIVEEEKSEVTFLRELRLRTGKRTLAPTTVKGRDGGSATRAGDYIRLSYQEAIEATFEGIADTHENAILEVKGYYTLSSSSASVQSHVPTVGRGQNAIP